MTDAPDTQAPADNSSLCLDFKLFTTWQPSLIVIRLLALQHVFDSIPAALFYGCLLLALAAFVFTAIEHRRAHNWRWQGPDRDSIQRTAIVVAGILAFLVFASRGMPAYTRAGVPEILFVVSLFAFAILYALKIANWTRAEFEACCSAPAAKPDDGEPGWMRIARAAYLTAVPLVVLEVLATMVVDVRIKANASPVRTLSHFIVLTDHHRHFWLTPDQSDLFHSLMDTVNITVPALILSGIFLRHVLNVKLFPALGGFGALLSRNNSR
jgi:hypothetical protein